MDLIYRTDENNPLVVALCQDFAPGQSVNLDVHAKDEMFSFLLDVYGGDRDRALANYFLSGRQIWDMQRAIAAWRFGDLARIRRLLDFASGYGRVTRFLVGDVAPERVWVADIYADGVRFQEEAFGVHGIVSTPRPAEFAAEDGRFECILVSSLFSHLPEDAFHAWLARLVGLLEPGGLLVFSVHDRSLLWDKLEMPEQGILFKEISESRSLEKAEYGTTWVTEGFVREAVERVLPGSSAHRIRRGYSGFQDLYVVVAEPGVDFSSLEVRYVPELYLDHCSIASPTRLSMSGWFVDRATGLPAREIQLAVNGRLVATRRDFHPRGDVQAALYPQEAVLPQGWTLEVELPAESAVPSSLVALSIEDAHGRQTVLYAGTLGGALLQSARMDLLMMKHELGRARAELESLHEVHRGAKYERDVAQARIAAMEASRFWKLRNAWFRLKRALRLTEQP